MKKILINFVTLSRNGIDIPRLLKFRELEKSGCRLYIFAGEFIKQIELSRRNVYDFDNKAAEFAGLPTSPSTKFAYMLQALSRNISALWRWREISRENYDVIYSPAAVLDLVLFPYFFKKFHRKTKWVVVFDNVVPLRDPGKITIRFLSWFFFKISFLMIKSADKVFVISDYLGNFLLERGFPQEKIILTANGIDNDLIQRAQPKEGLIIDALYMGRINETKGIYDMLKVLKIVSDKYPEFQFAIMGTGDKITTKEFKKKIKNMDLEKNVKFLGFSSGIEKFSIMKSAKCFWFLSVSESESFGVSLLEAVCCGLPAFAYDLPQLVKIYKDGEVDFSPKGNYKVVAEKVIALFEKGDFTNEKGKQLLGKYSWEKVARIEIDAIEKMFQ